MAQADDTANLLTDPAQDGNVSFDYDGVTYNIAIDSAQLTDTGTIQTVADLINNDALAGDKVTASVVNVGTTTSPSYELLLSGDSTGADFAISNINLTNLDALVGGAGAPTPPTNERAASDAEALVDGLLVKRSGNLFDDVIEGVSFTVTKADLTANANGYTTFGVSTDIDGIKKNVNDFLDEYNKVIDFIDKQESYTEEGGAGGDLFGDSILRAVKNTLQSSVFSPDPLVLSSDTDGFNSLGVLGIDLDADGRLTLNETKFDDKLSESLTDLADFFLEDKPVAGVSDQGILYKIVDNIEALVDTTTAQDSSGNDILDENGKTISVEGLFGRRKTTLQKNIDRIDTDISNKERSVQAFEAGLVTRYANLERLIGQLNSQQSYLQASGL